MNDFGKGKVGFVFVGKKEASIGLHSPFTVLQVVEYKNIREVNDAAVGVFSDVEDIVLAGPGKRKLFKIISSKFNAVLSDSSSVERLEW